MAGIGSRPNTWPPEFWHDGDWSTGGRRGQRGGELVPMRRIGFQFEFEIPSGWTEDRDRTRHVYQGPSGEELIVSGSIVSGEGDEPTLDRLRDELVQAAQDSARDAADHPDLKPAGAFSKLQRADVDIWELKTQTRDGSVMFAELIAASRCGVMLVTFEAPLRCGADADFDQFVDSIRTISAATRSKV